jgi:hypothetical protein
MSLIVLTLSTDDLPQVRNYEKTAKKFGYEYKLLGRGEKVIGNWLSHTNKQVPRLGLENKIVHKGD